MYSLGQSAAMGWGKVRRAFLIAFRKKHVERKLQRRQGACNRCGACCKILFQCPAYDDSDGNPKCLIYNDRPGVCGLFPLDEKDLRERDIVMPEFKCGYTFRDTPNGNGRGPITVSMPVRWGPSRPVPGKRRLLSGTFAILWSFVRRPNGSR